MLHESSSVIVQNANKNGRTAVPASEHPFHWWVVAARALWPEKTAAHLASLANVTERAAKFWLSGGREPSPEAFKIVFDRIMQRTR